VAQVGMDDGTEAFERRRHVIPQGFIGHEAGNEKNRHAGILAERRVLPPGTALSFPSQPLQPKNLSTHGECGVESPTCFLANQSEALALS